MSTVSQKNCAKGLSWRTAQPCFVRAYLQAGVWRSSLVLLTYRDNGMLRGWLMLFGLFAIRAMLVCYGTSADGKVVK